MLQLILRLVSEKIFLIRKGRTSVVILITLLTHFYGCKTHDERTRPSYTPLTELVYASVTIQPEDKYLVYASVGGIVKKVFVDEGDSIREGQPLLQVQNDNPKLNAENARLAYNLALENLSGKDSQLGELRNQIQSARLRLQNDSINFLRQSSLWENNLGTRIELDQRRLAYETARNDLQTLENRYGQLQRQLEIQLRQAKNTLESSANSVADFTISSQLNGKVYQVMKKAGEAVLPQEPLAVVGRADKFLIEMLVDEVDIARIATGQKVLVRLDAYNKQVFEAVVTRIIPNMDVRSQTFTVEAGFNQQPPVLYPGLTGEANIVVAKKDNALTIPYDYLINGNKVLTDDGEIIIETGLMNFEKVEVLSGLDTTHFIYKPNTGK